MAYRKLGRPTDQRKAILRNLTTALIWNGKVETTQTRAKEVQSIAEKLITLAVKEYDNTVKVTKNGQSFVNDGAGKLAARRQLMAYLYNVPYTKEHKESKSSYQERVGHINYPVVEKLFREVAPHFATRAKDLGQGGGYTRIIKTGPRRGDAAPMAILELI